MSKHKVYTLYIIVGVTMLLAACTMPAKQQTVGNKGQWKFSGDKHKSLQVDTERTFHQRYPLVML